MKELKKISPFIGALSAILLVGFGVAAQGLEASTGASAPQLQV